MTGTGMKRDPRTPRGIGALELQLLRLWPLQSPMEPDKIELMRPDATLCRSRRARR